LLLSGWLFGLSTEFSLGTNFHTAQEKVFWYACL
jgi:hypothetical protein